MALLVAAGALAGVVIISIIVEALRVAPATPTHLAWAPAIAVREVAVDGVKLRYLTAGDGPPLVLLHTLRTQLDMFQKVVPELARHFRVYAVDYPGHGYSDIPRAEYTPELFVRAIAGFLEALNINNCLLVGESIGGSIALLLAARHNPRVERVVAINPYDYDAGRGIRRSSWVANVVFGLSRIPILGATVMRLRQYPIEERIFAGGVRRPGAMPAVLAREMYQVGNRKGHYRAFMSLISHWPEWERARAEYGQIARPVLLLYGDHDWSRSAEREADRRDVPGAEFRVIERGGHFLSLDAPQEVVRAITEFSW